MSNNAIDNGGSARRFAVGRARDQKGYTLVEMVVVTGIFVIVMILTTKAFDTLISTGGNQAKTASNEIEGMVGLEMLRTDLTHAGYGLPWSFKVMPTQSFPEVAGNPANNTGVTASNLNETVPHALTCVTADATSTNPGTDYLVIKSALLPHPSTNSAVGRWGYLNYSAAVSGSPASYIGRIDVDTSVRSGRDRVITLANSVLGSGAQSRELANTGDTDFFYTPDNTYVAPPTYQTLDRSKTYVVYAISADRNPRMPYNRADYYVNRPAANDPDFKMPLSCNPGTGILFKAVAAHTGGYIKPYPLLNCVADMKVVYTLDPNGDGSPSYVPAALSTLSPEDLRIQLKTVTLYVLAHEGKMDRNYTYPDDDIFMGPTVGPTRLLSAGKLWSKTELDRQFPYWKNYRWKVFTIPVTPKNMQN